MSVQNSKLSKMIFCFRFLDGVADAAAFGSMVSILMVLYPEKVSMIMASTESVFGLGYTLGKSGNPSRLLYLIKMKIIFQDRPLALLFTASGDSEFRSGRLVPSGCAVPSSFSSFCHQSNHQKSQTLKTEQPNPSLSELSSW